MLDSQVLACHGGALEHFSRQPVCAANNTSVHSHGRVARHGQIAPSPWQLCLPVHPRQSFMSTPEAAPQAAAAPQAQAETVSEERPQASGAETAAAGKLRMQSAPETQGTQAAAAAADCRPLQGPREQGGSRARCKCRWLAAALHEQPHARTPAQRGHSCQLPCEYAIEC